MKTFKVYKHPDKEIQAVKSGFAWLAILFFPWWFLYRRLWLFFIYYILIVLFLAGIDYELYGELGFFNFSTANDLQFLIVLIEIVILLLPGFKGNEWTAMKLKKNGYELAYSVKADNRRTAIKLANRGKS